MGVLAMIWATATAAAAAGQPVRPTPKPIEPVAAIIEGLRTHDVVGSDLGHSGSERENALLIALIRDPRFPESATDLVVEGLGGRFQDAMDRYVRGETVPDAQLKPIWNDTTQPQIPGPMWSGSVPPLFQAVRVVNETLPRARQIRVLLGDPPIEWENVHSAADFQRWLEQRDSFPAEQIGRDVLAKGRHALALFGGGHLQRKQQATNYQMDHPLAQTVVSLVERAGATTFLVHVRFQEPGARGWPAPSLAIIRGTDLGAQPVPEGPIPRVSIGADGRMTPLPRDQWISLRQEEQFDAVVYIGAAAPAPALSSAICNDPAFVRTRLERMKFAGLPPSVPDRLRSLCGTP